MEKLEKELIIATIEGNNLVIKGMLSSMDVKMSDILTGFAERQIVNNNDAIKLLK